ncbi:hypothetical protein KY495_00855 [Massilia sp. PAMC28688]|uniref:hypothetical protein n=1 Tax=Massilia sp. PAMC28688 TaxID=2861283 RepID=UPI001C632EB5|nr:hypothetical protein [Massilia sp. PAMC28688]QYF93824.1 hypothetical protein KY495_00855 [Massilia sp. PAMC28688]
MEEKKIIGLDKETAPVAATVPVKEQGKEESYEACKARLKRQGDFYRVGIVRAKAAIKQGARPETLFHNAVDHAAFAIRSRVDNILRPTGINVATVMPYAVTALGFLRQRGLVKPAMGVMAAAAAGLAYYFQHRRHKSAY